MSCLLTSLQVFLLILVGTSACGRETSNIIADDPNGGSGGGLYSTGDGPIHSRFGWSDVVEIFVDSDVPPAVVIATESAVDSWNVAAGRELIIFGGRIDAPDQVSQFSTLNDNLTVVYFDDQWSVHMSKSLSTLATTVWENDKEEIEKIIRGDVILNGERYLFQDALGPVLDPTRASVLADVETTIVHELGHLLGLGHVSVTSDPDSVMHAQTRIGVDFVRRYPSDLDAELIREIYEPQ